MILKKIYEILIFPLFEPLKLDYIDILFDSVLPTEKLLFFC